MSNAGPERDNYPQVVQTDGLHPVEQNGGKEAWTQQQYLYAQHAESDMAKAPLHSAEGCRIGGWEPRVFWTIIAVICVVVVAASAGGTVVGTRMGRTSSDASRSVSTSSITTASPTSSRSPSSTPSALAQRVTTDCPNSNGTFFTPEVPAGGSGTNRFNKRCGTDTNGKSLIEAMVIDFDSCIALCSNWNVMWPDGPVCNAVTFVVGGIPPGNCWAKGNATQYQGTSGDSAMLV